MSVPEYLLLWAARPGPRRLLQGVRERLERGRLGSRGRIQLELTTEERKEIGQLLDATWVPSGADVSVRELRTGIAAHNVTLEELLTAIGGPLRNLPAESADRAIRQQADLRQAVARLMGLLDVPTPRSEAVAEALARWVIRRSPAADCAAAVAQVVAALPAGTQTTRLAALAAAVTGDAHALDRSKELGRAVARFLALRSAARAGAADLEQDPLSSAENWRDTWEAAGVVCDAISSRVLVLNLPLIGDAPGVALAAATPGEPVWLSLRSLAGDLRLTGPINVFVCENPTIVEAAADRLGPRSRPLVCTFGFPEIAVWTLLRAISPPARLHVRADGDRAGWSIVSRLQTEFPCAVRWRLADDCQAYEEELLDDLLADLARID